MIAGVGRIADSGLIDAAPFLASESACHLLRDACAESTWRVREVLDAQIVKERPERRRTLRYRVVAERGSAVFETTWYAKHYRGSRGKRVYSLLHALQSLAPRILVPVPIGYSPKVKLLVMSALEGSSLSDALADSERIDACMKQAGGALALVHKAEEPRLADHLGAHGPREEVGVLEVARRRASETPSFLQTAGPFMELCSVVEEELAHERPRGQVLLHRDLHPGQVVLRGDDGVGLLDWDDAALGEPELDLGNLEAHLFLDDLQRQGSVNSAPRLVEALRAGYLSQDEVSLDRIAAYRRAALLRLATLERLADPSVSVVSWASLARTLIETALI